MISFYSSVLVLAMTSLVACDRPVYNIGHMVNAVAQIDEWLGYGANALEADVAFADDGLPIYFYHGGLCDLLRNCWRWDYISDYVEALRERTLPSSPKFNANLVLFMFDLKTTELDKDVLYEAGEEFADNVLIPLYRNNPTKMKAHLSIADFTMNNFIKGVLGCLQSKQPATIGKIGFEVNSENNLQEPQEQEDAFKKLGVAPGHAWLSEGVTNWGFTWYKKQIIEKAKSLVHYRDMSSGDFFGKVYVWTINRESTAKELLELGLDAIITNEPVNMNKAIQAINVENKGGEKLRLATLDDNPFKKYERGKATF